MADIAKLVGTESPLELGQKVNEIIENKVDYNDFSEVTNTLSNGLSNKLSADVNKNSNGYMKFSNGMILQWGIFWPSSDPQNSVITLPIAFSNNGYKVCVTETNMIDWWNEWGLGTNTKYNTSFKIYAKTQKNPVEWIAIGW